MEYVFIEYPKCSTCKKAKQFLKEHKIPFEDRNMIEETPSEKELEDWISQSGLEIKRFFNTSGMLYKELKLKERLPSMSKEEKVQLLASNGMLIKRPLCIGKGIVLLGFKREDWERELL